MVSKHRVSIIEKFWKEGEEFLEKGDPVQSSEKFYKCAEECIKILVEVFKIDKVLRKVCSKGYWSTDDYFEAANELSKVLGLDIIRSWLSAWNLHVTGFHEMKLSIEAVKLLKEDVRKIIEITYRIIKS